MTEAANTYRRAADAGSAAAMTGLGVLLIRGKRAAALGNEDAGKALERLRCPFALRDSNGKSAGRICFDGG